jgi:hypothetical protein
MAFSIKSSKLVVQTVFTFFAFYQSGKAHKTNGRLFIPYQFAQELLPY